MQLIENLIVKEKIYVEKMKNGLTVMIIPRENTNKKYAIIGTHFGSVDNEFVVHDIKVIDGEKGLFSAMPSRKASDGEYRDIAHPINSATREQIQTIILDKYQEVMAEEAENEVLMEAAE